MDNRDIIRGSLAFAHNLMEQIVEGTDDASLYFVPEASTLNPIAATYVHAVYGEDFLLSVFVRQAPNLYTAGGWDDRLGLALEGPGLKAEAARALRIDFPAFRAYAQAVYAQSDATVAGLSDADLEREFEMGPLGKLTVAGFISGLLVYHASSHAGEIASLKGVQGQKGLPF